MNTPYLLGKEGIITQINKALLERILNAEMDFHLNNTDEGRTAGNSRNGYGKKTLKSNFVHLELSTPRDESSLRKISYTVYLTDPLLLHPLVYL